MDSIVLACLVKNDFLVERKGHSTHNVSCLLGRRMGALLPVDAYKVRQGGTAGKQRGGVAAKEGQQHLFKQQRNRNTFDTAHCGVGQLQRGVMLTVWSHIHIVLALCSSITACQALTSSLWNTRQNNYKHYNLVSPLLCCKLLLLNKSNGKLKTEYKLVIEL